MADSYTPTPSTAEELLQTFSGFPKVGWTGLPRGGQPSAAYLPLLPWGITCGYRCEETSGRELSVWIYGCEVGQGGLNGLADSARRCSTRRAR
jgi:hypothetical protein